MKNIFRNFQLSHFCKHNSKCFIIPFVFFMLAFSVFAQENDVTTLTIENAQKTEYKKNEETGNDTIILTGSVEISVVKGDVTSVINADVITYDRKTEILLAEGNVEISTTGGVAGSEKAYASSLIMNTSTLEGVFADGRVFQTQSDAINLPSGSTLIVFSELFGKSQSNTIAFKNSSLTFCDDENPHWHIDASRTWLLPGGEFAFLNAVLYVGPVPVFYLPAFYYPKDELVFNPTFGFKPRAGYFFNTTTYLMGRKPLTNDSTSGDDSLAELYNFMKPGSLKEQELQGLVLHNLDKDYTGDTSHYLKLMADWYTNLGLMVGIDGLLSTPSKNFSDVKLNFDLGLSNTVFQNASSYLPISMTGQRYWDKSNFLGLKLPFRYRGNFEMSLVNPIKISLSLPFYSDPYFVNDFGKRQESMDWISLLTSNSETDDTSVSEISSFAWKLSASYSPKIAPALKDFISSASINLNSTLNISSATNTDISSDKRASANDGWRYNSPERKFYYPSQITPASLSMSLNGNLFQYPPQKSVYSSDADISSQLIKPDELKTPKELELEKKEEENKNVANNSTDSSKKDKKEEKIEEVELILPELSVSNPSLTNIEGLNYRLSYSFNPNFNSIVAYNQASSPESFKWDDIKSFMYTLKAPLSLTSNLSFGGSFFTMNNKLSYEPVWQAHPNTDGYTGTQKDSLILADYNAESQNVLNTNSISFRPFLLIPTLADSGISWNSSMKLFQRKFIGDVENPDWQNQWLDFSDPDSVTSHSLDFRFSAKEMNSKFTQNFTYSTTFLPQVPRHSFSLNLGFPYVTTSFGTSFQETSLTDKTIIYNPLQQSLSLSLFDTKLRFTESFNWNYKENHSDSLKLSLNWKQLSASYVMNYTNGYDFDTSNGWISKSEKEFLPYSLSFNYSLPSKNYNFFSDKVTFTPGVSTSVVADLIRPTNSYFVISPSFTFKINDFLNITFSSTSRNSVIYRYWQSMIGYDGRIPGEQNPFVDLFNSFRFDSEEKRKSSGFKLKSLNVSLNHELHDWDLSMSMKFEPRLVTKNGIKYYDYNPYFSLGIFWRPMSSMKTQIIDDYGTLKLE